MKKFMPRNLREANLYEQCIPVEDLIDGASYRGHCRNASIATWNASLQKFIYTRHKFGSSFKEEIEHPDHDRGFDVFFPLEQVKE